MKKIISMLFILSITLLLVSCTETAPPFEIELLPGNDTIYLDEDWVDAGCNVIIEGETYSMERENNPITDRANEYQIKYTYEYLDFYEVTCLRIVKVSDNQFPTVDLNPGIDTVQVNEEHIDMGVTYEDDFSIEISLEVISDVDTSIPGTYSIIYKVTDMDRNQVVITRVVTVIE